MPQIRIPRGSHGEITTKQQPDGRWTARVQVRDVDGRIRPVRVKGATKGGALRAMRDRLYERVDPTIKGITPDTTYDTLAALWLQHRKDHGKVRTKGKLAPQTPASNRDLEEFVDLLLGTGMREGEGLAIRPIDLTGINPGSLGDLADAPRLAEISAVITHSAPGEEGLPILHVRGTLIEPRKGYVDKLHRQDPRRPASDPP